MPHHHLFLVLTTSLAVACSPAMYNTPEIPMYEGVWIAILLHALNHGTQHFALR